MSDGNWFWYLLAAGAFMIAVRDFKEGGWDGYWRKSAERNRKLLGGGLKIGRFAWRAYNRHNH